MNDVTMFAAGLVVAIPAGIVVIALVFAAGIDERTQKKLNEVGELAETRPL